MFCIWIALRFLKNNEIQESEGDFKMSNMDDRITSVYSLYIESKKIILYGKKSFAAHSNDVSWYVVK